jgi:DNA-directed RNA polymerase specialized sigma24 family protein
MKYKPWPTEPYGRDGIPGHRRLFEGFIEKLVQERLPGRKDTDVLEVVDSVIEYLEKNADRLGDQDEKSLRPFIASITKFRVKDALDRWDAKKNPHPGEVQMTRLDLVISPSSAPQKGSGGTTPVRLSFCGTESGAGGTLSWDLKTPGLASSQSFEDAVAIAGWAKMTEMGKESGQWKEPSVAWGAAELPNPVTTLEATEEGTDKDDVASLLKKYGVESKNAELLEARIDGLSMQEVAAKFGLSEKQTRARIDYLKKLLWAAVERRKKINSAKSPKITRVG